MTISDILSNNEFKKLIQGTEPLTAAEKLEYDAWEHAHRVFLLEELAKEYDITEESLPVRDVGEDSPGEDEVWVWNDEKWEDNDPPVGWHKTSMYGGYGKGDDAYCNWWHEPVCGRCGGNPYWLPGETREEDLPDLVPLFENLSRLSKEAKNRVNAKHPPYKGRTPGFASVFMGALPIIPLFDKEAFDKWKAADDAYKAKVAQRAKEKYGI